MHRAALLVPKIFCSHTLFPDRIYYFHVELNFCSFFNSLPKHFPTILSENILRGKPIIRIDQNWNSRIFLSPGNLHSCIIIGSVNSRILSIHYRTIQLEIFLHSSSWICECVLKEWPALAETRQKRSTINLVCLMVNLHFFPFPSRQKFVNKIGLEYKNESYVYWKILRRGIERPLWCAQIRMYFSGLYFYGCE